MWRSLQWSGTSRGQQLCQLRSALLRWRPSIAWPTTVAEPEHIGGAHLRLAVVSWGGAEASRMPPSLRALPGRAACTARSSSGSSRGGRVGGRAAVRAPQRRRVLCSSSFPEDYTQLVQQASDAFKAANADGLRLCEVQFPPGGLATVPGDLEGNEESNRTCKHLRRICDRVYRSSGDSFRNPGGAKECAVRVFFPDPDELTIHTKGAPSSDWGAATDVAPSFGDFSGSCTFILEPNFLTFTGVGKMLGVQKKVSERSSNADKLFVIAYPSVNIDEMLAVKDLDEETDGTKPILVVNGELDRVRSGYYPSFWARSEMQILTEFVSRFEPVYYVHNFKGSFPCILFRQYPGPWQVLKRVKEGSPQVIYESDNQPSLKECATEIIPKYYR